MLDDKALRHAQLIVSRAKIQMLESHPFYAHILTHLKFEFRDELPLGSTSATDGKSVFIQPERYVALPKGEQVTVLAHEQLHCLDGHLWRSGTRDKLWANVAQDIYIYHVLKSERFDTLRDNEHALTQFLHKRAKRQPSSGYAYDLDDFAGQFWEQIYEAITPDSASQSSSSDGAGDGSPSQGQAQGKANGQGDGVGGCYHPQSGPAASEAREQWKQWIREAGMYAKMAGATPGRWQELVDAATPAVPFETRFFDFLKRGLEGESTFDSFARRHISRGMYLPSEIVEQMGETVLVCDTSGSRSKEDLAYAYGVFRSWRALHPCKVHVVDCDTECHWRTFEEYDELPAQWEAKGRGGTYFAPPFEEVKRRQLDISLLVFFTDGYLFDHDALSKLKPTYETMWVLTGEHDKGWKAPFGEMVKVTRPEA
jgi:predicted metal-dependent peptidase